MNRLGRATEKHIIEPILVANMIIDWIVMAREQLTSWLELACYKSSWVIIK
jgi:hypothetical protein